MIMKKRYTSLLLVLGFVTAFVSGFLASEIITRTQKSELVLGKFMDQLAALYYLEKGKLDEARSVLRASSEDAIVMFDNFGYGAMNIDPLSVRGKMFQRYKALRDKYGPIQYPDNGYMNKRVDEVLKKLTQDQSRGENRSSNQWEPGRVKEK